MIFVKVYDCRFEIKIKKKNKIVWVILLQTFILFLKGFFIGIGKIIPGVSGSVLAISFGVYEESLRRIETFFHNIRENFSFLAPLGCGIVLAVLLGSHLILFCLEHYYVYTMTLFIGLILGTIPGLLKEHERNTKDWIFIFLLFLFLYFIYQGVRLDEFVPSNSLFSNFYVFFLGFLDAVTTVVPGLSGTSTFMVIGSYTFVLKLFSNPFFQIGYTCLFGLGLVVGVVLMIIFVNFCFRKYAHTTWNFILAFLFSSVFFLFLKVIDFIHSGNIFSVFLLFLGSFYFMNSVSE